MRNDNWHGVMKILEVTHRNPEGSILYYENNIRNLLHNEGEAFLLQAAFTGGRVSSIIPENYYLGLDNRSVVDVMDDMTNLIGEPQSGGYERQPVNSSGDFALNFENDHWVAISPIVAFRSTTGEWGPVRNLFLTNTGNNTGYLISTAALSSPIVLQTGDDVTMRIGMQLRDCPI